MSYVKNILNRKGNSVWTISPDATVRTALTEMAEKAWARWWSSTGIILPAFLRA
jgi:hypothetical protein